MEQRLRAVPPLWCRVTPETSFQRLGNITQLICAPLDDLERTAECSESTHLDISAVPVDRQQAKIIWKMMTWQICLFFFFLFSLLTIKGKENLFETKRAQKMEEAASSWVWWWWVIACMMGWGGSSFLMGCAGRHLPYAHSFFYNTVYLPTLLFVLFLLFFWMLRCYTPLFSKQKTLFCVTCVVTLHTTLTIFSYCLYLYIVSKMIISIYFFA